MERGEGDRDREEARKEKGSFFRHLKRKALKENEEVDKKAKEGEGEDVEEIKPPAKRKRLSWPTTEEGWGVLVSKWSKKHREQLKEAMSISQKEVSACAEALLRYDHNREAALLYLTQPEKEVSL